PFQPVRQVELRHPASPADLKPLVEIELIGFQHHRSSCQDEEIDELLDEGVPIAFLQRVVELVVPTVEQDRDADQRELSPDQGGEQQATRPAVLGPEERSGKPPDRGYGRDEAGHGDLRWCSWVGAGAGGSAHATLTPTLARRLRSIVPLCPCPWAGMGRNGVPANRFRLDSGNDIVHARAEPRMGTVGTRFNLADTPGPPLRMTPRGTRYHNGARGRNSPSPASSLP